MTSSSKPDRPGPVRRLARDARRLLELDGASRRDLARAVSELAVARLKLLAPGPQSWRTALSGQPTADDQALIDRVAFAIPRAAARVPWRSTCLVQALAAQRWLARAGIATQLVLGARKPADADMEAHAWLKAGKRIVVGGDPGDYQEFKSTRPA